MKELIVAVLLAAVGSAAWGQNLSGSSPSGNIQWSDDGANVNIWWSAKSNNRTVLCPSGSDYGYFNIKVSPDDYWLVVESGGSSMGDSVELRRRNVNVGDAVLFKTMAQCGVTADINNQAEAAFMKQNNIQGGQLDHRYVHVESWSRDSATMYVSLGGHSGGDVAGPGAKAPKISVTVAWIGLYDLGKHQFVDCDQAPCNPGKATVIYPDQNGNYPGY